MGRKAGPYHVPLGVAGSVFRDEFDLAILQLQENNRLEILKRKWWEGGKCPKEEDHRAKGKPCTPKGWINSQVFCLGIAFSPSPDLSFLPSQFKEKAKQLCCASRCVFLPGAEIAGTTK